MKRHIHPLHDKTCTLWEAICSMDNLKAAHQNAKKGKDTCKQFKRKMVAINKKRLKGEPLTYSECCSINSYNGWLIHCDGYRLTQKYIKPLEKYASNYYIQNVKGKGENHG